MDWAAVVLTGGTGARLGGADKAALEVAGTTLLERALAATREAADTVVVGPRTATSRVVRFAREQPVGAGPAAAVLAGVAAVLGHEVVVVLAVDMPLVSAATVDRLLAALGEDQEVDAAVLDDGRRQPLCAAYRRSALLAVAPAAPAGTSVRALTEGLRTVGVAALAGEGQDVDEWGDLDQIGAHLLHERGPGGQALGP